MSPSGAVGPFQRKASRSVRQPGTLLLVLVHVLACSSYTSADGVDAGTFTLEGPPPPGCDLNLEPKDSPACVGDALGFFVDAERGNDSGLGTRAQPFKTINKAAGMVGDKLRVFVCAGTYPETLRLGAPIKVFGGFACDTWMYDASKKVEVKPNEPGPALLIRNGNNVTVADLRFTSLPGTEAKPGSVGAVIRDSEKIRLVRVAIESGAGFSGKDGVLVPFELPTPLPGTSTKGPTLACPAGDSTAGGDGGNGQSGATAGQPTPLGGSIGGGQFGSGGDGKPGIAGKPGDAAGATLSIADGEVVTLPSKPGLPGGPGGGGGGNQGYIRRSSDGSTFNERGGSGGSGGCGGAGGSGGSSGGYSIALLALDSSVALESVTAVAGAGGNGGNGAVGQDGTAMGGTFGSGSGGRGGRGGAGAKGGTGGGGAGGASTAIAWWKIEPTKDGATVLTHAASAAKGGTGGNPGPDGALTPMLMIP